MPIERKEKTKFSFFKLNKLNNLFPVTFTLLFRDKIFNFARIFVTLYEKLF